MIARVNYIILLCFYIKFCTSRHVCVQVESFKCLFWYLLDIYDKVLIHSLSLESYQLNPSFLKMLFGFYELKGYEKVR